MLADQRLLSLIQKYDTQGPRYTSYPTAPQWKGDICELDYAGVMQKKKSQDSTAPGRTIALYTHIPFCEEKCYYCACNVVITRHKAKASEYVEMIKKELALLSRHFPEFPVTQIHWGGGTPTYLSCGQMESLFHEYKRYFEISPMAEISIEIDPRVTTLDQLKLLRGLGFNRASLGVQDFDSKVQLAINRHQTEQKTRKMYQACLDLGFHSVNMDFVYGLPFQTQKGFEQNLKTILDLSPDRIAFYNYAHVPWMVPWQKMIPEGALPQPELKLQFLQSAFQMFERGGYVSIGMDHFAKPHDELVEAFKTRTLRRNFMGYTTQKDSLLFAFGVSAISDFQCLYVQNFRKLSDYYRALERNVFPWMKGHVLSEEDLLRRHVIMELLCNLAIDIVETDNRFNISFLEMFENEWSILKGMVVDGLLDITDEKIEVTGVGRLFIRNICMVFDRYFQDQRDLSPKRYSRTI